MAWYDYPIHHGYITQYQGPNTDTPHYADDLDTGSQIHIPITSLFEGDVVKADYQPWGGEIFIRTNVPGLGPTEEYFYHNDLNEVSVGEHVKQGQEIALSGGQTRGGMHPTDPHWSTGPHIHVGFFSKYVPSVGGGSIPYGPDITPYLKKGGSASSGSDDPCWKNVKDGTPWQNVGACNPLNLQCFDPAQCASYIQSGLKVGNVGPAMSDTGPTALGQNAGTAFLDAVNKRLGVESYPDLLYRAGFIGAGILFIIFGLMIFSRSFMSGVQESAAQIV